MTDDRNDRWKMTDEKRQMIGNQIGWPRERFDCPLKNDCFFSEREKIEEKNGLGPADNKPSNQ